MNGRWVETAQIIPFSLESFLYHKSMSINFSKDKILKQHIPEENVNGNKYGPILGIFTYLQDVYYNNSNLSGCQSICIYRTAVELIGGSS